MELLSFSTEKDVFLLRLYGGSPGNIEYLFTKTSISVVVESNKYSKSCTNIAYLIIMPSNLIA